MNQLAPYFLMVPKPGFEPGRAVLTTPSRWRVYQFHHFGSKLKPDTTTAFQWMIFEKS